MLKVINVAPNSVVLKVINVAQSISLIDFYSTSPLVQADSDGEIDAYTVDEAHGTAYANMPLTFCKQSASSVCAILLHLLHVPHDVERVCLRNFLQWQSPLVLWLFCCLRRLRFSMLHSSSFSAFWHLCE